MGFFYFSVVSITSGINKSTIFRPSSKFPQVQVWLGAAGMSGKSQNVSQRERERDTFYSICRFSHPQKNLGHNHLHERVIVLSTWDIHHLVLFLNAKLIYHCIVSLDLDFPFYLILRIISLCVICLTFYVAMCLPRLTTSNKTISYCYNAIKSWIGWSPNLFFGTNGLNMSIMFRRFMIYQLISPAAQREFIGLDELFYILAILTQFGYFWPVLITKYRLLSIIAVPMLVPIWNILKMIVESFFI